MRATKPKFKTSKEETKYLALLVLLIWLVGFLFYFQNKDNGAKARKNGETENGAAQDQGAKSPSIAERLESLENLRRQSNAEPLTKEELGQRLKELEEMRDKSNQKPLTKEEINGRFKELARMRGEAAVQSGGD